MADFEIRIRLTGTTEGFAQHVAWVVRRELWREYPNLQGSLEPPRLVLEGAECGCPCHGEAGRG